MKTGNEAARGVKAINVAHRGAAGYAPENTMASFELALTMNADWIELDVHLSKDGELVVIHDETVDRTTDGTGLIKDLTVAELQALDAGRWFSEKYAGERIPLLRDVMELCRGRMGALIEIKMPWLYPGIERKLARELHSLRMPEPEHPGMIVQSFDRDSMRRFREADADAAVGILVGRPEDVTDELLAEYAAFANYVNPCIPLVSEESVSRIHSCGFKAFAWTVRSPGEVGPLLEAGVDGIITDYPDYVRSRKV
ncbi:glycerophosphodiester phosphodiesterase [Paenibacillus thermotolerans]|nr:glycerophosphodiester phosphodiesterase family protein [Paenibacillus sp. YIM B05602]